MTAPRNVPKETLITSVQRALHLVEIVANEPRPVTPKTLANTSGLSLGTTYNLVRTLLREGYLQQEPDGLVLGARFPGMRDQDSDGVFLARVRAALRSTAHELGVTAYFSRYRDGEVQLVDVVDAKASPRVELWVGTDSSAHATALGKQILAVLQPSERLDYLSRHSLEGLTPNTIRDRRVLLAQLERSATRTIDREEYAIGYTCLAVPVVTQGLTASIAVSLPADQIEANIQDLASCLHATARVLSLQLGVDRQFS